jgi:hypothetical protein
MGEVHVTATSIQFIALRAETVDGLIDDSTIDMTLDGTNKIEGVTVKHTPGYMVTVRIDRSAMHNGKSSFIFVLSRGVFEGEEDALEEILKMMNEHASDKEDADDGDEKEEEEEEEEGAIQPASPPKPIHTHTPISPIHLHARVHNCICPNTYNKIQPIAPIHTPIQLRNPCTHSAEEAKKSKVKGVRKEKARAMEEMKAKKASKAKKEEAARLTEAKAKADRRRHRDEKKATAEAAQAARTNQEWACCLCTFSNPPGYLTCDACLAQRNGTVGAGGDGSEGGSESGGGGGGGGGGARGGDPRYMRPYSHTPIMRHTHHPYRPHNHTPLHSDPHTPIHPTQGPIHPYSYTPIHTYQDTPHTIRVLHNI